MVLAMPLSPLKIGVLSYKFGTQKNQKNEARKNR